MDYGTLVPEVFLSDKIEADTVRSRMQEHASSLFTRRASGAPCSALRAFLRVLGRSENLWHQGRITVVINDF
jgi:hypothetical protein